MDYKALTPAQKEKLDGCKTPEDILSLAKEEGVSLTDADLDAITGASQGPFVENRHIKEKMPWEK